MQYLKDLVFWFIVLCLGRRWFVHPHLCILRLLRLSQFCRSDPEETKPFLIWLTPQIIGGFQLRRCCPLHRLLFCPLIPYCYLSSLFISPQYSRWHSIEQGWPSTSTSVSPQLTHVCATLLNSQCSLQSGQVSRRISSSLEETPQQSLNFSSILIKLCKCCISRSSATQQKTQPHIRPE